MYPHLPFVQNSSFFVFVVLFMTNSKKPAPKGAKAKKEKKPYRKPIFPFTSRKASRRKTVSSPSLDDVREAIKDEKKVIGYLVDYGILIKPTCPCGGEKLKVSRTC